MLAILWREMKLHYTKVYWLMANFVTPLFYLLFFGLLFSKAIRNIQLNGCTISYLHFFIPGLIVMQSFLVWSYTFALVNLDRRTRVIEMINMTSTHPYEYFCGRIISVQLLVFLKALILWAIGVLFFRFTVSQMGNIALALFVFMVSNHIWFSLGFILGLMIKTEDIRDIVMQGITLPLTFLSTIYYPAANVPRLLQMVIYVNPLTHAADVIRPSLLSLPVINNDSIYILCGYAGLTTLINIIYLRRWILYRN